MYLCFDIGGTNMRVGVSPDGKIISQVKIVPTPKDFSQGIQSLKQASGELAGRQTSQPRLTVAGGGKIQGVVGGIAGVLDKEKTMLVASPHIGGWIRRPLKLELEKIFNTSVHLENDTALVGLGEATKGAGAGKSIVAYLGIGTGIGGVRIVDQKIDKNTLGFEPGHQIIVPDGNLCSCGGKGHLEAYVGGSYIEKIYHQKAQELKDNSIWEEITKYLSIGLNNTIVHWSPDIVVLGGSVMESLPLEKVFKHLKNTLKIFPQAPQIVKASLGHDGGLHGALNLFSSNLPV